MRRPPCLPLVELGIGQSGLKLSAHSANRWQLSIRQAMKVVVFVAVPLGFLSPILRGSQPVVGLFVFCGVAVPLLWTLLSFVLVRRGPRKDRVILLLLLCSVTVALAIAAWVLGSFGMHLSQDPADITHKWRELCLIIGVATTLVAAWAFLISRLVRRLKTER